MKRSYTQLLWVLLSLVSVAVASEDQVCPTPLPEKYRSLEAGNIFSAYFTSWNVYSSKYQVEDIKPVANKLTHIVYAFVKPDADNDRCVLHDPWGDVGALHGYKTELAGNFAKLKELKEQFPHLKILLSVGGGTYNKEFDAIGKSVDKMNKFAQSCVDMLDFYDHDFENPDTKKRGTIHFPYHGLFDGLDIDWEWSSSDISSQQAASYKYFLYKLKSLLTSKENETDRKYFLVSALQASPGIYKTLDLAAIAESVDWFHVMAYDFFGPNNKTVGMNAPICGKWPVYSVDGLLHRIIGQGVSPQKLVLGIPSYGYVYEETDGEGSSFTKTDNTKAISYALIQERYLQDKDFVKNWHDFERVTSLYNPKERMFVSYDGIDSVEEKVNLAKQNKLQGVMLWKLSGDDKDHSIVHAMESTLNS